MNPKSPYFKETPTRIDYHSSNSTWYSITDVSSGIFKERSKSFLREFCQNIRTLFITDFIIFTVCLALKMIFPSENILVGFGIAVPTIITIICYLSIGSDYKSYPGEATRWIRRNRYYIWSRNK